MHWRQTTQKRANARNATLWHVMGETRAQTQTQRIEKEEVDRYKEKRHIYIDTETWHTYLDTDDAHTHVKYNETQFYTAKPGLVKHNIPTKSARAISIALALAQKASHTHVKHKHYTTNDRASKRTHHRHNRL